MKTIIYFVRHAEAPYIAGMERSRGLSGKGKTDAATVKHILKNEDIDAILSSPYERAILTVKDLADELGKEIVVEEDLRERQLAGEQHHIAKEHFYESKKRVYEDRDFSFPGGESSRQAQERAVSVIDRLLREFSGKSIVIGTHGDIMTLMMNHFDPRYDFAFWESTTMPDIYQLEFENHSLFSVTRLWNGLL